MGELTPEQVAERAASRPVEVPKVSLAGGVFLSMAERIRLDETISEDDKMQMYRELPRNRREARRLLKGNGPWGIARRR